MLGPRIQKSRTIYALAEGNAGATSMKVAIKTRATLVTLLLTVSVSPDWAADSRERLMARMDFSKEQISQDVEVQIVTAKTLPKNDPTTGALALPEAEEINKLHASPSARSQAESLAVEAEKSAAAAKAKQEKAEKKYEAAKRGILYSPAVTAENFALALDIRTNCQREAEEARQDAQEKAATARQARESANKIVAQGEAEESKLEKEPLARVTTNAR